MNTAAELEARWLGRDNLYSQRKTHGGPSLNEIEINSVMWWRKMEVALLPSAERPKAVAVLAKWLPPRGRQGNL